MGNIFIEIFKKITILNSILMIIYCFFHPDLGEFEFMFIIMILLLISWIAYIIFFARKSIYIDYLMLLLLGLFLGNRIAIKANLYILNRVSKKKINK